MRLAASATFVLLLAVACLGTSGEDDGPVAPPSPATDGPDLAEGLPDQVREAARDWKTDWSRRSIGLDELILGIVAADPRDVIPPIDQPAFETAEQASTWLADREPVVLLELDGEAKAYPLQILTWHEIVNDVVDGRPIAITFCPLCNSAVGFLRTVNGQVLRFGTSGMLRNSDLVMWDRQTESLWQQITGEAIVGELTGEQLEFVPVSLVRWQEFRRRFPEGRVLSRETGFGRDYGINPYESYDSSLRPFLYRGEPDDRYPAMERVVAVSVDGTNKAYPFSVISGLRAVNDEVAGTPIVVLWGAEDTASALDSNDIAQGRPVGTGVAYLRTVKGRALTLEPAGDAFVDRETGSTWDILGKAVAGELAGARLQPAVHANHFWFAWAAFNPGSAVYAGD